MKTLKTKIVKPAKDLFTGVQTRGRAEKIDPPPRPRSSLGISSFDPPSISQGRKSDVGTPSTRPPAVRDHHLSALNIDVNRSAAATLHGTSGPTSGLEVPSASNHHVPISDVDEHKPPELSSYFVDPTAAYERKSNWRSNLYASAGVVINVLKESSDACTPLKSVAGGLSTILTYYDQTVANRGSIESLIPRIEGLAESLTEPVPDGEVKEINRREALKQKLEKVLRNLKPLEERGKLAGFLNNVKDAETLTGLAEDVRDAMLDYQTALQQDIYLKNHRLIDNVDLSLLKNMYHAAGAGFSSGNRKGCLKGTRKGVLLRIEQWLMDEKDQRICWLNGLAGTGKTTVAQTFAETTFADGKLGASFFCSRDFEERCNLQAIFPTLAFQLAHRYPQFRQQLLQVLKASPDIDRDSLSSQFENLIVRPLKETQIPTLIIIDALDECKDEETASTLLSELSHHVREIPEVKFFITGRPEPQIRDGFRLKYISPITNVLELHNVERSLVDSDIKLYLKTKFNGIRESRRNCEFPEEWPNPDDTDTLCKKAAGFFIYASTLIKFVSSKHHLPTERLDQIILRSQTAEHEAGVDSLYTQILDLAFRDADPREQEIYSHFRIVVGAVLLTFRPISRETLLDLLSNRVTPSHINATLDALHSLLHIPDNKHDPIRIFHKSFSDFLTCQSRCQDDRFFIDPPTHHQHILFSCIDLMEKRLKRNICDLDDYAVLNEIKDLPARRRSCTGNSLEYACHLWTRHLASIPGGSPHANRVQEAIDKFFTAYLLRWIEVLGITGHLAAAPYAISEIRQWYTSVGIATSVQADDSERFILENFDTIRNSPSQIYHSALPFTPSSSWLRESYKAELGEGVRVLMGVPDKWDTCSRTITLDGQPTAFSHCRDVVAVGMGRSDVLLLDAITGTRLPVLSEHTNEISSLAFSLDGTILVSGSRDRTVKLWDAKTGGLIKSFDGHPFAVSSVAISPDCTTVASGTDGGTVHFWGTRAERECRLHVLEGRYTVTAVNFSPANSQRLISSSAAGIVQQWETGGRQIGTPILHETFLVHVAYSPDGTRFVMCGGNYATVRDSEFGAVVARLVLPNHWDSSRSCCFSPDGRFVAASLERVIYVWDISGSEARLAGKLVGHSGRIASIVFSSSIISASQDKSVKIWPSSSFLVNPTITDDAPGPPSLVLVKSIDLMAKDGIVITGDSSGVVKTWDLATGDCKSSFSTQARRILGAHLTGDTLIAACWERSKVGGEYRIWDVGKGADQVVRSSLKWLLDLRVSEDGSKIFGLDDECIEARSLPTGENAGKVQHGGSGEGGLIVEGSKVWLAGSKDVGWDFGGGEIIPFSLPEEFPDRIRLDFIDRSTPDGSRSAWIRDAVTGKTVFHLPQRYARPDTKMRWDGRYLLVGSPSGEVVVMDFNDLYSRLGFAS